MFRFLSEDIKYFGQMSIFSLAKAIWSSEELESINLLLRLQEKEFLLKISEVEDLQNTSSNIAPFPILFGAGLDRKTHIFPLEILSTVYNWLKHIIESTQR